MRLTFIAAVLAFLADQASKTWILYGLGLATRGPVEVIPGILTFRLGWNTGVNFGLFANSAETTRWILIAIALIISAWIIVGGALANALDRVIYGAVVDFLNTTCCGFQNPYTFNIADIAIFAGAAGLLIFADAKKITP